MSARPRTVLLIAFHFPPIQGSSGVQRTLRFAQHLPRFGWRPIVLSIGECAYEAVADVVGNEVPAGLEVHRAFGLNAATQLSLFGRYPTALALPDRWATWRLWAVRKALRIIRAREVDAVWSTFPIATAHKIGLEVARRSGVPWIAEFRDPMWQSDWPVDPIANRSWRELETEIFSQATRAVFVAPGAAQMYAERFPAFDTARLAVIENGYDEQSFRRAEESLPANLPEATPRRTLTLLHSGIIYSSERDPTHFFAAVATLKRRGRISADRLQILLRAAGTEYDFCRELERLGIADVVKIAGSIDYLQALQEMLTVDGLLILQAANCNAQIPAKLYEYLRAGRPILALTDPAGDTAATLRAAGTGLLARLDSAADIEAVFERYIADIETSSWRRPSGATVQRYSRQAAASQLAGLLDSVTRCRD